MCADRTDGGRLVLDFGDAAVGRPVIGHQSVCRSHGAEDKGVDLLLGKAFDDLQASALRRTAVDFDRPRHQNLANPAAACRDERSGRSWCGME